MRASDTSAGKMVGAQFVVENKAGASGMLGPIELSRPSPHGYTLSQLTIGIAGLPQMQKLSNAGQRIRCSRLGVRRASGYRSDHCSLASNRPS
jgi:tripartite-type tricarboxylate transporter receptor subunit TctC